ncbi:MAG: hypothetical protein QW728_05805 [Thermoplasmata archaeon]
MAEDSVIDAIVENGKKFLNSRESKIGIGGFVGILIIMAILFYYQVSSVEVQASSSGGHGAGIGNTVKNLTATLMKNEMVEETKSVDMEYEFNTTLEYAFEIVFTLTWTDEEDMTPPGLGVLRKCTNQPDTFVLEITAPNGKNQTSPATSNTHGSPGIISLKFNFTDDELRSKPALGNWSITVKCTEAGDQYFPFAPLVYVDSGNEVNLDVAVSYRTTE